jgi:hypothetical protein
VALEASPISLSSLVVDGSGGEGSPIVMMVSIAGRRVVLWSSVDWWDGASDKSPGCMAVPDKAAGT